MAGPPQQPNRFRTVTFRLDTDAEEGYLEIDPSTGEMRAFDATGAPVDMVGIELGVAKESGSGQMRKLATAPLPGGHVPPGANVLDALLDFAAIVAVDATPCPRHPDRAVVGMVRITVDRQGPDRYRTTIVPWMIADLWGVAQDLAERIGWKLAHEFLRELHPEVSGPMLVVTDAELGQQRRYNERTAEPIPGWLLPQDVQVAYAKDQSLVASPAQHAVRRCDALGRWYLRLYPDAEGLYATAANPGDLFRSTVCLRWDEATGELHHHLRFSSGSVS
jgi:hypothetical protein